jgi:hypothetical protein
MLDAAHRCRANEQLGQDMAVKGSCGGIVKCEWRVNGVADCVKQVEIDGSATLKLTGLPPGAGWVLALEVAGYIAGAIETGLGCEESVIGLLVASVGVIGKEFARFWATDACVDTELGFETETESPSSAVETGCGCRPSSIFGSSIVDSGCSVTNESNSEKSGVGIEASLMVSRGCVC